MPILMVFTVQPEIEFGEGSLWQNKQGRTEGTLSKTVTVTLRYRCDDTIETDDIKYCTEETVGKKARWNELIIYELEIISENRTILEIWHSCI